MAAWLVPPGARRVADLGAGTGGFSRVVAARGAAVVAIELDPRMAAVAAARSPGVAVVNARAERLPLRSGCLDAAVVSSAWHWMDHRATLAEVARVLRPGGVLGVVWNGPARSVEWVAQVLDRRSPGVGHFHSRTLEVPPGSGFGAPEHRTFRYSLPRTPEELVGLAGTYSRLAALPAAERDAAAGRIARLVEDHPAVRGRRTVELPMGARCWRTVRSPG